MPMPDARLRSFWPIYGTRFIFCEIHRKSGSRGDRLSNLIINFKTGKCVLRVDWNNLLPSKEVQRTSSRRTEHKGILFNKKYFSLIYEQFFRYDSSEFQRTSSSPNSSKKIFKKKKDIWCIDIDGEARKLENPPDQFIHNQTAYRCLDYTHLLAPSPNYLLQYQLNHNSLVPRYNWNGLGNTLSNLFSLPTGGFVLSNNRKKCVSFLNYHDSHIHSFSVKEIFNDLPMPPKEVTPWEQLYSQSWQLVPLSTYSTYPVLAYFQMPGFPIFEIYTNRIQGGKSKEIFHFLGYSPSCRPFLSINENQVILFTQSLLRRGQEMSTATPIYILEKQEGHWPTEARFTFQPKRLPLPGSIQRICEMPLDDDFLLAYGRERFWRIFWDGSIVKPIYPRFGMSPKDA